MPAPVKFAYGVPNVSGGLVTSKIEQRTDWGYDYNRELAVRAENNGFEYALSQVRYMAGYGAEYQHESTSFSLALLPATERHKVIAAVHPGPLAPRRPRQARRHRRPPLARPLRRERRVGLVQGRVHAAIDAGIAAGALAEAAEFVRTNSRPWFESGVETAAEDPLLIQRFGELALQVRASEALLRAAADAVDAAAGRLTDDTVVEASIAVAAAKVQAARAAVDVSSALFEVSGTRSALNSLNLHRHWRDARTHTLHDPTRWKIQHIGRYTLDGTRPPRHGLL